MQNTKSVGDDIHKAKMNHTSLQQAPPASVCVNVNSYIMKSADNAKILFEVSSM